MGLLRGGKVGPAFRRTLEGFSKRGESDQPGQDPSDAHEWRIPSEFGRQEVEIARIELAATISDVVSLRAKPSASRIKYRAVDEYDTEFLPQKTSRRAYSLRELTSFLDSVEQGGLVDPEWQRFGFVLFVQSRNICEQTWMAANV